jgi:adenine/guanine phosphoribosyltransferase-like PRPP-binding protein
LLTLRARRVTGFPTFAAVGRVGIGSVVAASVAGLVMFVLQLQFAESVVASLLAIVVAAAAGGFVFAVLVGRLVGVSLWALVGRGGNG